MLCVYTNNVFTSMAAIVCVLPFNMGMCMLECSTQAVYSTCSHYRYHQFFLLHGADNTIACFYKILTLYMTNMEVNITKEMVPDVTKLPKEDQHQELSHRKAVYLQGVLLWNE